jgi:hypothetical protein
MENPRVILLNGLGLANHHTEFMKDKNTTEGKEGINLSHDHSLLITEPLY